MRYLVLAFLFLVGLAVSLASFPTAHAHLLGMAGICFVPLIVALKTTKNKWRQLALSWLFFQIFFWSCFGIAHPNCQTVFFTWIPSLPYGCCFWCHRFYMPLPFGERYEFSRISDPYGGVYGARGSWLGRSNG